MRRLFSFFVLLAAVSLPACGDGSNKKPKKSSGETADQNPQPTPAQPAYADTNAAINYGALASIESQLAPHSVSIARVGDDQILHPELSVPQRWLAFVELSDFEQDQINQAIPVLKDYVDSVATYEESNPDLQTADFNLVVAKAEVAHQGLVLLEKRALISEMIAAFAKIQCMGIRVTPITQTTRDGQRNTLFQFERSKRCCDIVNGRRLPSHPSYIGFDGVRSHGDHQKAKELLETLKILDQSAAQIEAHEPYQKFSFDGGDTFAHRARSYRLVAAAFMPLAALAADIKLRKAIADVDTLEREEGYYFGPNSHQHEVPEQVINMVSKRVLSEEDVKQLAETIDRLDAIQAHVVNLPEVRLDSAIALQLRPLYRRSARLQRKLIATQEIRDMLIFRLGMAQVERELENLDASGLSPAFKKSKLKLILRKTPDSDIRRGMWYESISGAYSAFNETVDFMEHNESLSSALDSYYLAANGNEELSATFGNLGWALGERYGIEGQNRIKKLIENLNEAAASTREKL